MWCNYGGGDDDDDGGGGDNGGDDEDSGDDDDGDGGDDGGGDGGGDDGGGGGDDDDNNDSQQFPSFRWAFDCDDSRRCKRILCYLSERRWPSSLDNWKSGKGHEGCISHFQSYNNRSVNQLGGTTSLSTIVL